MGSEGRCSLLPVYEGIIVLEKQGDVIMNNEEKKSNEKGKSLLMRLIEIVKKLLKIIKLLNCKKLLKNNRVNISKYIKMLEINLENIDNESDLKNKINDIEININKLELYILKLKNDLCILDKNESKKKEVPKKGVKKGKERSK